MVSPIDQMILSAVKCVKCGAGYGQCGCWAKCKECGCLCEKGKECRRCKGEPLQVVAMSGSAKKRKR